MSAYRSIARSQLLRAAPRPHVYRDASRREFRAMSTGTKRSVPAPIRTSGIPYRYLWYLLTLGLGATVGLTVRAFAKARFDSPAPGSKEDEIALKALEDQMDELEIVKAMRRREEKGNGGWIELNFYENVAKGTTRTLSHAMAGIQGLGVQRAFWNSETREMVSVLWLGPRLTGWPGVVHGGCISTVFEDAMSRMIAGPNVSVDSIPSPTSMSVTYARPTTSFNIYIVRTSFLTPDIPQELPPPESAPAKSWLPYWKDFTKACTSTAPEPPLNISGTLESLEGEVKARAKGTWPASAMPLRSD